MPGFEVWDLIKVPFPYTNRPVRQHRPALVVRVVQSAGAPDLLWVLMVTSVAHRRWALDIDIADFRAAGLPSPSMVRTAKIATIEAVDARRLALCQRHTGRRSCRSWPLCCRHYAKAAHPGSSMRLSAHTNRRHNHL
ncbi:type II toxin-antitoxin system PemK/MazF family toxin [Acetobacter okinawensis]|uniref:type II toxin-antitoxin system PemK/MazF family toxin n=1 Tax=Acetobacter okinawensis TaxID=1076594 RepID=UPI00068562D2